MIVHPTATGWSIIHQQAHGLLAFQLALHWNHDKRPANWPETLAALLEHDDGQDPFTKHNHISKAGAPLQFVPYSITQCHRMIDIALYKSRWNALMVSRHATFLYKSRRGENKDLDSFLDKQKENQKKWLKEGSFRLKDVDYAYAFLQWCDALSLVLCREEIPPEERQLEVSKGPDGIHYFIHQRRNDESLTIDPWPFATTHFDVYTETYNLQKLKFKDDHELKKLISTTAPTQKKWVFKK